MLYCKYMSALTDEELIDSFIRGQDAAFKELVERYTAPLYNFSARLAGRDSADDIVQDIFMKAWRNVRHFDPAKAKWKTWIFTVARNTATDYLRRKRHMDFSDLEREDGDSPLDDIPGGDPLPDEAFEKLEQAELLGEVLGKLRPRYCEVLTLRYQEDMSFEEIGRVLGRPMNSVKSDHYRALRELRELLG